MSDIIWSVTFKCHVNTISSQCVVFTFSETEKQERAFTLGLAGLLGEGVYNFGELVSPLGILTMPLLLKEHSVSSVLSTTISQCLICWVLFFNFLIFLSSADAPSVGVFKKHRQAVAYRNTVRLQQWQRHQVSGFKVILGSAGQPKCAQVPNSSGAFVVCKSNTEGTLTLQPDLAAHEVKLMQKIQLLCIMEVICLYSKIDFCRFLFEIPHASHFSLLDDFYTAHQQQTALLPGNCTERPDPSERGDQCSHSNTSQMACTNTFTDISSTRL